RWESSPDGWHEPVCPAAGRGHRPATRQSIGPFRHGAGGRLRTRRPNAGDRHHERHHRRRSARHGRSPYLGAGKMNALPQQKEKHMTAITKLGLLFASGLTVGLVVPWGFGPNKPASPSDEARSGDRTVTVRCIVEYRTGGAPATGLRSRVLPLPVLPQAL